MKKAIIVFFITLAIISINSIQIIKSKQQGFTLEQLINLAFASDIEGPIEDYCGTGYNYGGYLYTCYDDPTKFRGEEYGEAWCYGTVGNCESGAYYWVYSCDGTEVGGGGFSPSTCS